MFDHSACDLRLLALCATLVACLARQCACELAYPLEILLTGLASSPQIDGGNAQVLAGFRFSQDKPFGVNGMDPPTGVPGKDLDALAGKLWVVALGFQGGCSALAGFPSLTTVPPKLVHRELYTRMVTAQLDIPDATGTSSHEHQTSPTSLSPSWQQLNRPTGHDLFRQIFRDHRDYWCNQRLEAKMPGRLWLQFEAHPADEAHLMEENKTRLVQTVFFDTRGLLGVLSWRIFHWFYIRMFSGLASEIAHQAEGSYRL